MCGWAFSWRMSGPATSNWGRFLYIFLPMALECSSHVLQEHLPQASHFFHLLMFSAFLALGHCLFSHNHHENDWPNEKQYYGPLWTLHKLHSKLVGFLRDFLPRKVSILRHALWSEIVRVPNTPAGSISSLLNKYREHYWCNEYTCFFLKPPTDRYCVIQSHGRLARWIKWRACDVGEAKEGLEDVLWRRWSNGRVGEWAAT